MPEHTAPTFRPLSRAAVTYAASKAGSVAELLRDAEHNAARADRGNPLARSIVVARLAAALEGVREAEARIIAALGEGVGHG